MDIWGDLFRDHHAGLASNYAIERDDGQVEEMDDAEAYFIAPRGDAERALLSTVLGRVLDAGAGPGSYSLHLQEKGCEVVTVDASHGAMEVARARGCRHTRVKRNEDLKLPRDYFDAVLIMGNTLGIDQTPETMVGFLRRLNDGCRRGARLIVNTIDPLDTKKVEHLEYHARNREVGRPPGLTRIRLVRRGREGPWSDFWMPTDDEMLAVADEAGWTETERHDEGPWRLRAFACD